MHARSFITSMVLVLLASLAATPSHAQEARQHTIVLIGLGETVGYTITVDGSIEQARGTVDGREVTAQENDRVEGERATGFVGHGGSDGFRVEGRIQEIVLDRPGAASVYVDGQPFHQMAIEGTGETVRYTVGVDGAIEPVSGELYGMSATIQENDSVDDGHATGYVGGGGVDAFHIFGRLTDVSFARPGAARVLVDGVPLHTLAIRGTGETVAYTVEVDGRLQPVEGPFGGLSASIQENDVVTAGTATGFVGDGGVDAFLVYGDRPDVTIARAGAAEILIDGEAVSGLSARDRGERTGRSSGRYRIAEAVGSVTDRAGEGPIENTRRLDLGPVPLRELGVYEQADRPCSASASERYDDDPVRASVDVCRNESPLKFYRLFQPGVMAVFVPEQHWVVGAEVCVNHTGRNARLKGIRLRSMHAADYLDGAPDGDAAVEEDRSPNCSHWSTVSCPYPQIATGVETTWRRARRNEWINGLRLICRTVTER